MNKAYNRINWENYPSLKTPANDQNLNKMDGGLDEVDNRVISLDTRKFDKSEAQGLIKNITFDLQTGILKKYYYNGSTEEINTGISKLNMNLRFDKENQILYIVNADGTEDPVDLSVFITNYEFEDSDTIAHNVSSDGTVTSIVKDGSITEDKLQPNYLADIKVEVAKAQLSESNAAQSKTSAENSAKLSESYARGGTGVREGEDSDNAKKYKELAEQAYENLQNSNVTGVKGSAETEYRQGFVNITAANIGIEPATSEKAGLVKPDEETTYVDADGTLHAAIPEATVDYEELDNKPSINGNALLGNKTLEELGGASIVRLTQAQYDALPDSKLTDNKIYLITDGGANDGWTAENIYYYNGTSGLLADNVQAAIDEIAGKLNPEGIGAFPGAVKLDNNANTYNIKKAGIYIKASNVYLQNAPDSIQGRSCVLIVIELIDTGHVKQILMDLVNEYIYNQYYNNSTSLWSPWRQLPTGIKGAKETEYRGGYVNLTPENIGAKRERYAIVGIITSSALTWKTFAEIITQAADSYGKITFLVTRCHKSNQSIFGILCLSYTWIGGKYTFSLDWIYATDTCYPEGFACDLYTSGARAVRIIARVSCEKDYVWTFTVLEEDVNGALNNYGEYGWTLFESITADGDVGSGSNYWTSEFKYSVLRGAQFKNITAELLSSNKGKYGAVGKNSWISYAVDGIGDWYDASSITGLLRVVLPQDWSNTTIRFTVSILNYKEGTCADYYISGYPYSTTNTDGGWMECTAVSVGKRGNKFSDLPVKFGKTENGETAITIGNINTVWHYPKAYIHDIMVGQNNVGFDKWAQGWGFKIWAYEMNTIQVTIPHPHVTYEEPIEYHRTSASDDTLPWASAEVKQKVGSLLANIVRKNGFVFANFFFTDIKNELSEWPFLVFDNKFMPMLNTNNDNYLMFSGVIYPHYPDHPNTGRYQTDLAYIRLHANGTMYLWLRKPHDHDRAMISFSYPTAE